MLRMLLRFPKGIFDGAHQASLQSRRCRAMLVLLPEGLIHI